MTTIKTVHAVWLEHLAEMKLGQVVQKAAARCAWEPDPTLKKVAFREYLRTRKVLQRCSRLSN